MDLDSDLLHEDFSNRSNEYSGNFDKNKLKTGTGNLKWNHSEYQRYQGQFFQDCLHGRGRYNWSKSEDSIQFAGNFYANKLEGYGKFFYNDCKVFEGLYKDNVRFGPGMFTYKDGSQDVGMWFGKNLMRLCRVINADWIPKIAQTSIAKVKLLKYKKLVPIYNETLDAARDILEMLEVPQEVMKQSDKLYNIHIRNPKSNFFNAKLYDIRYFCEKDCYIKVAFTPSAIKTYYEEANHRSKDEINLEEASEHKSCCEEVPSDVVCVCENPKQVRINSIKLELERTEIAMKKVEWRIRIAKCKRRYAIKREKELKKFEILNSETVCMQSLSDANEIKDIATDTTPSFGEMDEFEDDFGEEEYDMQEECQEESTDDDDDITADDGTNYETACKLLTVAKCSLETLFIKKLKLTDQLNAEYGEIEEKDENECTTQLTKRVLITDLLAWNNEELSIDMMKHAFLHRNFENGVPFSVSDILCGDRSSFNKIGIYEESCGTFLTACSNGNYQEALDIFYKYDLHPDLCDSRGNTGIIYAAARDKIKMIKILVNLGAKVDSMNDDCFTPLGIGILRYLAVQHKVTDWEKAFLKYATLELNEETNVPFQWRPHVSLSSLNSAQQLTDSHSLENFENVSRLRGSKRISHLARLELLSEIFGSNLELIHSNYFIESIMNINHRLNNIKSSNVDVPERFVHKIDGKELQNYLFVTDCIKPPPEKKTKEKKVKKEKPKADKNKKKQILSDEANRISIPSLTIIELSPEEIILNNKLSLIYNTIEELISSGANPNICEVPQPTLILSLFTKELTLVELLLINKADPNVTTLDENLSALHILVSVLPSIEFVKILKLLLKYSGNPNFKASPYHWVKEKQELLGKSQLIEEDHGKTPLHLLCMRYDFKFDTEKYLNDMAFSLITNGFDSNELYLGHTPLSIAMLRGNIELIKTILDSQLINPNQCLGENMGISLTVFILKRYSDTLPDFKICCEIIEILINYKANPFKQILNIGNVIEFMIKEHEPPPSTKSGKKGKPKPEKKKKGKGKSTQEEVKQVLFSFTKSVLERHLKGWIVNYLFWFVQEENYYDKISEALAKFLNVEETIRIAQLLFNRGKIKEHESNYETLHDLIEMIINSNSVQVNENIFPSSKVNIHELIEKFQFTRTPNEKGKLNLSEPEAMQHNENYNVCYQCLRKQDRQLFACPTCKLIYFCSLECNKLALKVKNSFHKCGTLFYKEQEELYLAAKRLEQLNLGPSPENKEEVNFGPTEREIRKDKSKLLHLRRYVKKYESATGLIFLSESDADLRTVLKEKFGIPARQSGKFSKARKYGGIDKHEKLGIQGDDEYDKNMQLKGSKSKSSAKTKSSDNEDDDGEGKKTKAGKTSKGQKNKSEQDEDLDRNKKDGQGKDKKDTRSKGKADGYDSDEIDGKHKKEKSAKGLNDNKKGKSDKIKDKQESKPGKISNKVDKETLGGKSKKDYGRSKSVKSNKEKVIQQTDQSKNTKEGIADVSKKLDQLELMGIENYALMSGGKELELQRRLPQQYQYFLEKISEYWPDFDISMLFLPYACYRDGQLYYRFVTQQPIFMETYSTL